MPLGLQEVEAPRFLDNRHMKAVRLLTLRIGRLYPQGHGAAVRKNPRDPIGNRTRDLPACKAAPQQPRTAEFIQRLLFSFQKCVQLQSVAALPLEKEPFIPIAPKACWVPRTDRRIVTMRKIRGVS
jgi:hypothetical protein